MHAFRHRIPCAECQVERDKTGLDGIWCSSPECYVLPEVEPTSFPFPEEPEEVREIKRRAELTGAAWSAGIVGFEG